MGYSGGYRGGDDRWRGREEGRYGRSGGYGGDWSRDRADYARGHDDDRGFFERAGDEVRSWFGDDEAERRREADQRRYEREQGRGGGDYRRDYGRDESRGRSTGYFGSDYDRSSDRYASGDIGQDNSFGAGGYSGRPADTWGGSGFGGGTDSGRRFDRIDAGSTGTHGAHPMSSPVGGAYGAGYGISAGGGYGGSSARSYAAAGRQGGSNDHHDRHYSEWRQRQIASLDRDYDDYRRENQSRFEQEFHGWREKRQGQRSSLGKVTEHMEVVGSDGEHIGKVDKVRGDRIVLAKNDEAAGGRHHSIPCSWIESVDQQVTVNKTAEEAKRAWTDEERNRALFERDDDEGNNGPHILDRSFSGTYRND